jgi:hypothetical protein
MPSAPGAVSGGLGDALFAPALGAAYLDITPERDRSAVMGIKGSAAALGAVAGPLLVALVRPVIEWEAEHGARLASEAILTLIGPERLRTGCPPCGRGALRAGADGSAGGRSGCRAAKVESGSGRSLVDVVETAEDDPSNHLSMDWATAWHRSLQPQ